MMNALPHPAAAEPSEPLRSIRAAPTTSEPAQPLSEQAPPSRKKSGKIVLPTMEGMCFEKVKHIAYLEASGNYSVLHFLDGRQILVCKTLREVEQLLPEMYFVRIHRSHTIHLRHIKKYVRGKGGHVVLQNSVTLTVSAGQKDIFLEALKLYFK
ncbi:MAG: LytTR family transcriptional regulator [Saprospirales bacterium]|nr:LytTR family transcriptional regulator [Saprospirales bacterium]MBK8921416.1 LytTR family transcriptional regulator [Saprospirales bacterium]